MRETRLEELLGRHTAYDMVINTAYDMVINTAYEFVNKNSANF